MSECIGWGGVILLWLCVGFGVFFICVWSREKVEGFCFINREFEVGRGFGVY